MNLEPAILHLSKDARLANAIRNTNLQVVEPSGKVYFELLESIVSQQLSVKAAATIFGRFCALFPENDPDPKLLATIDSEHLRSAGLSGQKASYLKNVAAFSLENNLDNLPWENYSDTEIIHLLTRIKGVGVWTSEMILMFTLGRPDVFPADDLGIQQAMIKLYNLTETGKMLRQRMFELSEDWRPYRSIGCRYLWRWKDQVVKNAS